MEFDLGQTPIGVPEFRLAILNLLRKEAVRLHVPPCGDTLPSIAFDALVRDVAATSPDGQCVVLVDEYDKPLLRHLSRPDVRAFRDELKPFYGVIKYAEEKQRFTIITGVGKFSKVSIFSDLNNLRDLTMTASEATLLGYTHDELKRFFPETLKKIAAANALTPSVGEDGGTRYLVFVYLAPKNLPPHARCLEIPYML